MGPILTALNKQLKRQKKFPLKITYNFTDQVISQDSNFNSIKGYK